LEQEHLVGFQTRPPDECGTQEIGIRDLIQNALFMRPDRVIIGDCKGDAVLDVLEVMHAGHDGSMTSGLANTPEDMLRRLETMVLATGLEMPPRAVREQIAGAFNLVVQLTRFPDGSRRVTSISEVAGMNHDTSTIILRDIYRFRQKGLDENGKLCGQQIATGHIPRFIYQLQEEGHEVDMTLFGVEDEVDSEGEGES
jgi:Flp pilus assembly CpaF family ATPase